MCQKRRFCTLRKFGSSVLHTTKHTSCLTQLKAACTISRISDGPIFFNRPFRTSTCTLASSLASETKPCSTKQTEIDYGSFWKLQIMGHFSRARLRANARSSSLAERDQTPTKKKLELACRARPNPLKEKSKRMHARARLPSETKPPQRKKNLRT